MNLDDKLEELTAAADYLEEGGFRAAAHALRILAESDDLRKKFHIESTKIGLDGWDKTFGEAMAERYADAIAQLERLASIGGDG